MLFILLAKIPIKNGKTENETFGSNFGAEWMSTEIEEKAKKQHKKTKLFHFVFIDALKDGKLTTKKKKRINLHIRTHGPTGIRMHGHTYNLIVDKTTLTAAFHANVK